MKWRVKERNSLFEIETKVLTFLNKGSPVGWLALGPILDRLDTSAITTSQTSLKVHQVLALSMGTFDEDRIPNKFFDSALPKNVNSAINGDCKIANVNKNSNLCVSHCKFCITCSLNASQHNFVNFECPASRSCMGPTCKKLIFMSFVVHCIAYYLDKMGHGCNEKKSSFAWGGAYAHRSSLDKYFSKIPH